MSTPLAIVNLGSTGAVPAAIGYYANPKKAGKFLDGLHTGAAVGTPKQMAQLLLSNHHNPRGRRVARTAVISVKTPRHASRQELEDIDQRLVQAFWDFQKTLKVPMLGWIHTNTATRHLHIIFPNSNGVRCLDLRPRWLRQLQGFAWTAALLSGRGKGRRKALPVYPQARNLVVRDLANLLMDDHGNLRPDQWRQLVQAGKATNFRQRKDGSLISFEYGGTGRRVRVATLQGFITECQNTQPAIEEPSYATSPHHPEPGQTPASSSGLDPLTPAHPNDSALAPKAGPQQCGTVPVAGPAKPTVTPALALIARTLEPTPGNELAPIGAIDAGLIGANPLSVGRLAGPRRRFKRRPPVQPAPAARPVSTAPRFQRPSRPGFGF